MTIAVPTTEPLRLRAGETWAWTRDDLSDYPASVWTLKYAFKNAFNQFSISATADGDHFLVLVGAGTTAYAAGTYRVLGWVESYTLNEEDVPVLSERHSVYEGWHDILPSFAGTDTFDARSHARRQLANIEAAIEALSLGVKSYTIGERSVTRRDIKELLEAAAYYRSMVRAEEVADGKRVPRLLVRL